MLLLFLLQLLGSQTQFTNLEKSFIDGQSENLGWTIFTQDQTIVNSQLCDKINHTSFFSAQAGMLKLIKLPPHNKIDITFQVLMIGTSEQANFVHGWVDQEQIDKQQNLSNSNCSLWYMSYKPLAHFSESALIVIKGNGTSNQLWGIRDFIVNINNCPNSCQRCDSEEECEQWEVVVNQTFDDSSDSTDSILYKKQSEQMSITQHQLPENYKAWISFLYISYYQDDKVYLQIDDDIKTTKIYDFNYPSIGFNNTKLNIQRIGYQYDNKLTDKSSITIKSNSKEWGIRDLFIYTARSQVQCNSNTLNKDSQNQQRENILQNSLLSVQSQAIEVIFDRQLKQVSEKVQYYHQYNVINGIKGQQITSTLNGGSIIGGHEIFDINTSVEKNFYQISKPHRYQGDFINLQFKLILYLIGNQYIDHQIIIQFWRYDIDYESKLIEQKVINSKNYQMGNPQEEIKQRVIQTDDICFQKQDNELLQVWACQIHGQFELNLRSFQYLQFEIYFDSQEQLGTFEQSYEDTIKNVYWGFDDLQLYYQPKPCGNLFLSTHSEKIQICENNIYNIQLLEIQSISLPSGYNLVFFNEDNQQNELIIQENQEYLNYDQQKQFKFAKLQQAQKNNDYIEKS